MKSKNPNVNVGAIIFSTMNGWFYDELDFVMKHRKGYNDHTAGKDTPAARRYARGMKRWKEKQRRSRLKCK